MVHSSSESFIASRYEPAVGPDGTHLYWNEVVPTRPPPELDPTRSRMSEAPGELASHRPTVILHDGIGCDGWAWHTIFARMSASFRIITWHYRGHGRSETPRDKTLLGPQDLARDGLAVMDAARVDRAHLVGYSMGVQVALEHLRIAPARVQSLALVCGSVGRITHTFHGNDLLHQALPGVIAAVRQRPGFARALWGRMPPKLAFRIASLTGELDTLAIGEEDFTSYMTHITSLDPELFLNMLEAAGEHTAEDMLASIKVPTLVLGGERDKFTPLPLAKALADGIPGSEFVLVRGGTHGAPMEQPTIVEEALRSFYARLDT